MSGYLKYSRHKLVSYGVARQQKRGGLLELLLFACPFWACWAHLMLLWPAAHHCALEEKVELHLSSSMYEIGSLFAFRLLCPPS